MYRIFTGDKAYSSWSLRGWLLLAAFDLPFEDVPVRMYDPALDAVRRDKAPARTLPILEWEENGQTHRVWDTLAIAETLHERHPEAGIWPADPGRRGIARSLAAEMHSSFATLRSACPMNIHRVPAPLKAPPEGLAEDVARIGTLWSWAKAETGGPWLGGPRFSVSDVFFAPVALRFHQYALSAPGTAEYTGLLLEHASVMRWIEMARADSRRLNLYDRE
jgi:glutathione S-transferase